MSESSSVVQQRKQSLLQKYGLHIDCLSFEHIEKCSSKKELEKILKILRSGEEGSYPALEKAAEEKLRKLAPNNHLLQIEDPVIPTSALEPKHRQRISNDVQMWAKEMIERDQQLLNSEPACVDEEVPTIRNSAIAKTVGDKNKVNTSTSKSYEKIEKKPRKCVPNDYTFWDKFDADNEILKMDLEEEREKERKEKESNDEKKIQRLRQKQEEQEEEAMRVKMKDASVGAGDGISATERTFNAELERNKGNECFRTKAYTKALHHYTRSIDYHPTIDAHNNRAQTYLKLQKYTEAVADSERVLQLDPSNVKGFYRRGVGYFFLKKYDDALHDFENALRIDPNNQDCQDYAKRTLAELKSAHSKRVRMAIQVDKTEEKTSAVEEDKYYPFFNTSPNENIELNEIGTAKVMCRCSGTPGFMKKVRSLEDIKEHGRLCLRRNSKSSKRENSKLKQSTSNESNMNKTAKKIDEGIVCNEGLKIAPAAKEEQGSKEFTMLEQKEMAQLAEPCADAYDSNALENIKTGYSFTKFWNGIKGSNDLATVAKFLRSVNAERIKQVVANKLDVKMLGLFIMALRVHFTLPADWEVVQRYLLTFTQLPRFASAKMMLDKTTKLQLESLLNEAEGHGLRVSDLLQLYGVTDCLNS